MASTAFRLPFEQPIFEIAEQIEDLEERGRTAFRQGHYGKALDTLEVALRLEARGKPWKQ